MSEKAMLHFGGMWHRNPPQFKLEESHRKGNERVAPPRSAIGRARRARNG
jgi:hypothetical protein